MFRMTVSARAASIAPPPIELYFLDMGISVAVRNGVETPRGRIMKCDADGQNIQTIIDNINSVPDGLAIDPVNRHIYYTSMGWAALNDGFISRIDLDGSNNTVIIPRGVTWTPKQLALDLTSTPKKMYWCDREGMRVFSSHLDGSNIEVLFQAGDGDVHRKDPKRWCVGIAIDTQRRILYWTQAGPTRQYQGSLLRAQLDLPPGETALTRCDVEQLLNNLPEPLELQFRPETNTLYMTDRGDLRFGSTIIEIEMAKFPLQKNIRVRKSREAIGLTLDRIEGKMYFTDFAGTLYSADMNHESEPRILIQGAGELTGVACVRDWSRAIRQRSTVRRRKIKIRPNVPCAVDAADNGKDLVANHPVICLSSAQ